MAIKIGHAAKDENGNYKNGKAGDQTGAEVYSRTWYNRPWNYIIRCTDSNMAEKIAYAMEKACANTKIGYDQNQRNTLLTQARKVNYDPSKVTTACETDCSALVCVCCMYAGIPESKLLINSNCLTTSTLRSKLKDTGKFQVLIASKYLTSGDYLKRGDILLYEGHHVAVTLSNGSKSGASSSANKIDTVKEVQIWINSNYNTKLTVDNEYGKQTKTALIKALQTELNQTYGCKLKVDGVFGLQTKAAIRVLKKGAKNDVVKVLQAMLVCHGYSDAYVDGDYGSGTEKAVIDYKTKKGLTPNGNVGKKTFGKLCA